MRIAGPLRATAFSLFLAAVVGVRASAQERPPPSGPAYPPPVAATPSEDGPFRAAEALRAPAWVVFGLEQRTRFEHLENDFRAMKTGNARALSMRTLLSAELRFTPAFVGAELIDARIYATGETTLDTTHADPIDFVRAYAGLRADDVFAPGDTASLLAGRFTMDLGSRRLVSRDGFRNTLNTFTGLLVDWTSPGAHGVRAFAAMPVRRLPADPDSLHENEIELDRENTDALAWSLFYQSAPLVGTLRLEGYLVALHERDGARAPSADRRLVTPGVRIFRAPEEGALDYEVEAMVQLGRSRASSEATDTTVLSHRAGFVHASGGYRFGGRWSPRLVLQYDFASGDRDPTDGRNGRFDPLFGARRFELGPSGIYGAFARRNVQSVGVRFELAPHPTVDAFVGYRLYFLASPRDAWTTAGLVDPTGESGSLIGQQLEGRLIWNVFPGNLAFEIGAAYLARGEFAREAPGARSADPVYVYAQVTSTL